MDHVKGLMDAVRQADRMDSERFGLDVAERRENLKGLAIEMDSHWKTPRPDDLRSRDALSERLSSFDLMLSAPNQAADVGLDGLRRSIRDLGAELHLGKADMRDPRIREIAGLAWDRSRALPTPASEAFRSTAKGPRAVEPVMARPSLER